MSEKSRYWMFEFYPESAPTNWKEVLQQTMLPICVSPIHDRDLNQTGEPKKAHYHALAIFSGPTTFQNVKKSITEKLNAPIPIIPLSLKGAYEYFTHKNNPEKFQYDKKDIIYFNMTQSMIDNILIDSDEQKYINIKKIVSIIEEANIVNYMQLVKFMIDNDEELYRTTVSNTILFRAVVEGQRYKKRDLEEANKEWKTLNELKEEIEKAKEELEKIKKG